MNFPVSTFPTPPYDHHDSGHFEINLLPERPAVPAQNLSTSEIIESFWKTLEFLKQDLIRSSPAALLSKPSQEADGDSELKNAGTNNAWPHRRVSMDLPPQRLAEEDGDGPIVNRSFEDVSSPSLYEEEPRWCKQQRHEDAFEDSRVSPMEPDEWCLEDGIVSALTDSPPENGWPSPVAADSAAGRDSAERRRRRSSGSRRACVDGGNNAAPVAAEVPVGGSTTQVSTVTTTTPIFEPVTPSWDEDADSEDEEEQVRLPAGELPFCNPLPGNVY